MSDLPASLLTDTYRDLLTGGDVAHEDRVRRRMRERVYTGIRNDGPLLFERLDATERRKIFRKWEKGLIDDELEEFPGKMLQWEEAIHGLSPDSSEGLEEVERAYLREGITCLLAFLYLGIEEGNLGEFDEILESALSKAAGESGRTLDEFEFAAEMSGAMVFTPETIAEHVRENDKDLTIREAVFAFEKGALSREELESYLSDLSVSVDDLIGDESSSENDPPSRN